MKTAFSQYSDRDPLQEVVIGRYQGYQAHPAYVEIVNEEQKKGLPSETSLKPEFEGFRKALAENGVQVRIPGYAGKFVYDQLTPRDIGITIGRKFILCNMAYGSRRYEAAGIFDFLNEKTEDEPNVLIPPHEALLEGGDIILDKRFLFAGISQRTNLKGTYFLQQYFGNDFEIIPVYCRRLDEGENVLHLDCTFNPVGRDHALIYPEGFREIPETIQSAYKWIEIGRQEQAALATNVLSIHENLVISRDHPDCKRVNEEMRKVGVGVIELPFDGAPHTGGSFRCCSLPLVRKRQ